jgi:hypothetical protein
LTTFESKKSCHLISIGDWILFLDGDERVTQKLKLEILSVIKRANMLVIKFVFPFLYESFLYHKVDKVVRLVKTKHLFTGDVHENYT